MMRSPVLAPLLCVALLLVVGSCAEGDSGPVGIGTATELAESHRTMIAELARIAEAYDGEYPLVSVKRMEAARRKLERLPRNKLRARWRQHTLIGQSELRLENVDEALKHLSKAHQLVERIQFPEAERAANLMTAKFDLGIAYLRLGEIQNCCERYTAESCILPLQGGAIHTLREGSEKALELFLEILNMPTEGADLNIQQGARWLLNIAAMTLGEYPEIVPEEFRLPAGYLESPIEFPRFQNIAPGLGFETLNLSGGAIVDDLDNDGHLDIFTTSWDPSRNGQTILYRNNGDGTYENRTEAAGLTGLFGGLNAVQADYDNDGYIDIYIVRGAWARSMGHHPNSLLHNNGDGTFTDVTYAAGLALPASPTKTAAWADYDLDGDVDLYVANDHSPGVDAPSQLFRNNGDGTFTDVAPEAGVDVRIFAMGVVWGDYDNDRYPDLFLSHEPNSLFHNNGDGTFTDVTQEAGIERPLISFPCWFWDYDNDGNLDIYSSASSGSIGVLALHPLGVGTTPLYEDSALRSLQKNSPVERDCLYRGDGLGGFVEVGEKEGVTYPSQPMGANFGDLDNDGYLDFYLATGDVYYEEVRPNVMFVQRPGKGFVNVTMAGGFGHLQKGHGVAFADLDNDGDQDVYVQMGGAYPGDKFTDALFENPGFGHHWLTLELVGVQSNRAAIGARVHVRFLEDGKQRSIYRHVTSGGSFGCNPLRVQLGLGRATSIEKVEISWPVTGETQVFEDIEMDQFFEVIEGETELRKLDRRG